MQSASFVESRDRVVELRVVLVRHLGSERLELLADWRNQAVPVGNEGEEDPRETLRAAMSEVPHRTGRTLCLVQPEDIRSALVLDAR